MNGRPGGPKGGAPKGGAPRAAAPRQQAPRMAEPRPQPKPHAPKPEPRQTRPAPAPHVNMWKDPTPRPRPARRRPPRMVVPPIVRKRNTIQLAADESCYFEGRVRVETNLLFNHCEGFFYITSERLIMEAPNNSFNVYINDVSRCRKIVGAVELTIISRMYRIYSPEAGTIKKLIDELMYQYNEVYDTAIDDYASNNSYVAPVTTATKAVKSTKAATKAIETSDEDPYEEIKKLKELMDMGIISEEEFEMKKKQLLGI